MTVLLCLGLPAALTSRPAYAATITVTTTVDEEDTFCGNDPAPPLDCSLRDALAAASTLEVDTITFAVAGPFVLTQGEIPLNKSVTIDGGAARAALQSNDGRILNISDGAVTLTRLTIQGGNDFGGGVVVSAPAAVTVSDVHFTNNRAMDGGAIDSTGTVTISNSIFDYNTVATTGGAIRNGGTLEITGTRFQYNGGDNGATLYNSGGTLTATGCYIATSTASGGTGGGLRVAGGTASLTNCTVRDHKAEGPTGGGGGIAVDAGATLNLTNVTVADNIAGTGGTALGGGGILNSGGTVNLRNTLVANNTVTGGAASDLEGAFASGGYNLVRTPGAAALSGDTATNITGQSPLLGALGEYGAPNGLETYPLLPGSPAIDAAACAPGVSLDQRGITRALQSVAGTGVFACDIGAFESRGFAVAVTSGSGQSADIGAAFASPLVATVSSANSEPVAGGLMTFTGPAAGAGIAPAGVTATADAGGAASASVTANTARGGYAVSAGGRGIATPASFSLTNRGPVYVSTPAPGSAIDLGSAVINTAVDVPALISVSEGGELALNVTGAALSGPNASDFSVTPTTLSIADGGAAQSLSVSCTPSAVAARTATLTVTHNAAGSPATYTLTCTGTAAPAPAYGSTPAPGATISLGTAAVGATVSGTLTVREVGTAALSITGAVLSGPAAADFSVSPTSLTIANGGAEQTIAVSCTPSTIGTRTATLTVSHNAGGPAVYTLTCRSEGMFLPVTGR